MLQVTHPKDEPGPHEDHELAKEDTLVSGPESTDTPVGEDQAAKNRENESPA
jgi:hypothetical protein